MENSDCLIDMDEGIGAIVTFVSGFVKLQTELENGQR